jgi:hypothetical protein
MKGWLMTTARNFAKKQRDPPRSSRSEDAKGAQDTMQASRPQPEPDHHGQDPMVEQLARSECRELLDDCLPTAIMQLPDKERTILLLRYVEKLPFWRIEQMVLGDERKKPARGKRSTTSDLKAAKRPGGRAHRCTENASRSLRTVLLDVGDQTGRKNAVRDCLESAAEGGHQDSLLYLLEDALRQDGDNPRIDSGTKDDRKEDAR